MPGDLEQRLEEGIAQIFAFVPQLLAALGILLAGFAIAKMIEHGTDAALHRIGFDRWMREGGVTEALARAGTELDPSSVIAKLVFWTVMVLVILLAASALGLAVVSSLFYELLAYIPNVIAAVIVLVLGIVLGEFTKDLILASAGALPGGVTLARAAKAAVIVLAVFMALEQLEIAEDIVLVAFIAVVGAGALAAGIAFGLGGREVAAEITRAWYERSRELERRTRAVRMTAQAPTRPPSPGGGAAPAADAGPEATEPSRPPGGAEDDPPRGRTA
ncbi:MAG TPA: hypothetical protein VF212_01785 [Longimicrobiales bacterium]